MHNKNITHTGSVYSKNDVIWIITVHLYNKVGTFISTISMSIDKLVHTAFSLFDLQHDNWQ